MLEFLKIIIFFRFKYFRFRLNLYNVFNIVIYLFFEIEMNF